MSINCEKYFSRYFRTRNYVITWLGGKFSKRKPLLVGRGGEFWHDIPKIGFRNPPGSSFNSGHTNVYINIYTVHFGFNDIDFATDC